MNDGQSAGKTDVKKIDLIIQQYEAGLKPNKIVENTNYNLEDVIQIIKTNLKWGKNKYLSNLTQAEVQEVIKLFDNGWRLKCKFL